MEQAQLVVHRGGIRVPREYLSQIPTPEATATWKPLPHHVLVDALHDEAASRQITVIREEYAIQRKQNMLVGVMVLNWMATEEFAAALAFRHSNDMQEAIKLYAGVRVFACDNTAVAGDEIILRKKHSPRFDIRAELPEAFDRYQEGSLRLQRDIEDLKGTSLMTQEAKHYIFDIFRKKVVPIRLFHPVIEDWYTQHPAAESQGDLWQLVNCFTTHMKKLPPNVAMRSHVKLGRFFGLGKDMAHQTTL